MKQSKKPSRLLHNQAVTAAGIILLMVSVGGVLLPSIFADTKSSYAAPRITSLTPNSNTYTADVTWSGSTPSRWEFTYNATNSTHYIGGVHHVPSNQKSATIDYFECGQAYAFRVYAVDKNDNHASGGDSATFSFKCPAVSLTGLGASGTTVSASWADTAGIDDSYTLYIRAGSGSYVAHKTTARSLAVGGSCGTIYTAYVTAVNAGKTSANSNVGSVATAACPKPAAPAAPAPAPKPAAPVAPAPKPTAPATPAKPTPTSTSKSSKSSSTKKPTATAAPAAAPATSAPATPGNFAADVQSQKIVNLAWDAVTGNIDHYVINRSTDNATWSQLATTKATNYQDNADFDTTYYYQLQAVGGDGQTSGLATAQAATDAFSSTSNVITSDDKNASVTVPDGAIDGDYNCSLDTDQASVVNIPLKQHVLTGPYLLSCVTSDGTVVKDFKKPVMVKIKTGSTAKGYTNLTARTSTKQGWDIAKAEYDAKNGDLSFTLTASKTFAGFGEKKHSYAGLIIGSILGLLLIAGGIAGFLWWRRRQPAPAVAAAAAIRERTAEEEFRQAMANPDCTHKGMAQPVTPSGAGCLECEQQHTQWRALRICLICGHVGCSDDSDQRHAYQHYQQTGHPIVYDYADPNGNSIGWCYIDQTYI